MGKHRTMVLGATCKNGHKLTKDTIRERLDRPGQIECRMCARAGRSRFNDRKPIYDIWKTMHRRCWDRTFKDWDLYGGAGVTVCERWNSYEAFAEDMGQRPSKQHSIDRKDGTKGYEQSNCKWSTPKEQARNMSRNRLITHNGEIKTIAEWAEICGLKYMTLFQRINRGMDVSAAITTPAGMPIPKHARDKEGKFTAEII